jgi:delta 1-pyrroline-5-carboxylate dehydrogenase
LKIKRKIKTTEDTYSKTMAENDQQEFFNLKQQMKQLESRSNELKARLDKYMSKNLHPDKKGHFLFTVLNENGERIHLQKQARKKVSLNEERAKAYLLEKGFNDFMIQKEVIAKDVTQDQILAELPDHFKDVVEAVDEDYLTQLIGNEEISMEDFESICDINITYAMTYIADDKLEKESEEDENAIKGNGKGIRNKRK